VLGLGLAERRRTFAILHALGARRRQVAAFIWGEVALTAVGGALLGAAGAWALSHMLVKALAGVFDPPPAALAVPWAYFAAVGAVALGAVLLAALVATAHARAGGVAAIREL
jgi:putative ABC transport system permease protein